jgi:lipopolysaccharide export LptBFGC system permease protein LptF
MKNALTILIGAALAYVWRYVWAGHNGVMRRVLAVVVTVVGLACFALAGVMVWGLTRSSAMNGAIIAFIVLFVVVGVSLLFTAIRAFQKESL